MELSEIRRKIEQLKEQLEVAEAEENREIRKQIERWKLLELRAEAGLNKAKPGEITRDPITLKPHPLSAALYGAIDPLVEISGWQANRPARGSVIQRMDTTDLLESIDRDGIRVPLVINEDGIIISGCRRWKAALQLGLTSVPVEVKSFENEVEARQAILDYNCQREKTFSQKMREAELLKEIAGRRAKRKMLDGRRDPTLILGEGYSAKRHNRETDAIVGAQVRMGKDTFRKGEHIWNKAKQGNWKAAELIGGLDRSATSVNAAYTTLKKYENSLDTPKLSRNQRLEPVDSGEVWTCPHCNKRFRLLHGENRHRFIEMADHKSSAVQVHRGTDGGRAPLPGGEEVDQMTLETFRTSKPLKERGEMRIAAINCSHYGKKPGDIIYNLGVDKIANYHRRRGDEVYTGPWAPMMLGDSFATQEADKFYFSVIFTWDIPDMIRQVRMVKAWGKEVEIGGPAATFMSGYIARETGIRPQRGLDDRFEHIPGDYQLTFTARGCPHKCQFCGVRKVEPVALEYDDFSLAPIIGDNNILATSWKHQELVVNKLVNYGREIDINSGFDVRFFQEKHHNLYSRLRLAYWRFAFDTMEVEADVRRVAAMMRANGLDRHQVTFYCLIGFPGQTPKGCLYRLNTLIELGHNPYPMRFTPLNSLRRNYVAPGWTEQLLQRMTAYYQTPYLWMSDTWENFRPS